MRTVLVAGLLAVAGLGACGDDDGDGEGETPTVCPADALLGPNGESYGRDPEQDCRFVDPQSARLIEAYLDRVHPTWQEDMSRAEAEPGAGGIMTRDEALEVLGLAPGASEEEIRAGFALTDFFLHQNVFDPHGQRAPEERARFVALATAGDE